MKGVIYMKNVIFKSTKKKLEEAEQKLMIRDMQILNLSVIIDIAVNTDESNGLDRTYIK